MDITYCSSTCDRVDCFRNQCHVRRRIASIADLNGSDVCPKSRTYYRHIPDEYLSKVSQKFAADFLMELQSAFCAYDLLREDILFDLAGTVGWHKAFKRVCEKHSMDDLIKLADDMEWFDYDHFAAEFTMLCVYWRWVNGGYTS